MKLDKEFSKEEIKRRFHSILANKCIFVSRPRECRDRGACLQSYKINCLLNHQHLAVTEEGKIEMVELMKKEVSSSRRYKEVSGH